MGGPIAVKNAADTWVNQNAAAKNYNQKSRLFIRSQASNNKYAWLYFNKPWPAGATIISAKLRLYSADAWTGSTTLTVQRAAAKWGVNKVNYNNMPGVTGATASVTQSGTNPDELYEIDVTALVQAVANGAPWYGFRVSTNRTGDSSFHSAQSPKGNKRPVLIVTWSDAPDQADGLSPAGGRSISIASPILTWEFSDPSGDQNHAQVQVQFGASEALLNAGTATWDSGQIPSESPQLDLSQLVNLLADPGFESGAAPSGWTITNGTAANGTTTPRSGTRNMAVTATAAGSVTIESPKYAVTPGMLASARAYFRAATTGRTIGVYARWRTAAGVYISDTPVANITDNTAGYTLGASASGIAPPTAGLVSFLAVISGAAAGEVHYLDDGDVSWGMGPAWTPTVAGAQPWWRSRSFDGAGLPSPWSLAVQYTHTAKGVLTITSPAAPASNFLWEGSPTVSWTFTGTTQKAYQVAIALTSDPENWLWDSGKITSADTSVAIPFGIIKDASVSYRILVRIWDTVNREAIPNDPVYVEATRDATIAYDNAVATVTSLAAVSDAVWPIEHLTFIRATAPDYFQLQRSEDGGTTWYYVDEKLPSEITAGGTNYAWDDVGPAPYVAYVWRVVAVVAGKQSGTNPTVSGQVRRLAPFLMRKDGTDGVCFINPQRSRQFLDIQELHERMDGAPVLVTQLLGGSAGHVSGRFVDNQPDGVTAKTMKQRFLRLRRDSGQKMKLAIADETLDVYAYNFKIDSVTDASGITYAAEFDWVEATS
jgi:hypothetical protein